MHTFIKAYAKTRGTARLYPLFAPINMGHVNADGWFASIMARYTQVGVGWGWWWHVCMHVHPSGPGTVKR